MARAWLPETAILVGIMAASVPSVHAASKQLFTRGLQGQFQVSAADLKKVQFYVSRKITLHRQLGSGETGVSGGKIVSRSGIRINEVIVKADTPGILVYDDGGQYLQVSFEEGSDIGFSSRGGNACFCLAAHTWVHGVGQGVQFAGQDWEAVDDSSSACLNVDTDSLLKIDKEKRTLKGRKVK